MKAFPPSSPHKLYAPASSTPADIMTEVLFLSSVQGYTTRVEEVADKLRASRLDVVVKVASPEETAALLPKWKLKYGPAVVIDDRLEFVGIPRLRTLVDRIALVIDRKLHPPPTEGEAASTTSVSSKPSS